MTEAGIWCRIMFPMEFKTVAKIQEQGFIYITKRDRDYRPTIVLECAKFFNCLTESNEKEIFYCIVYAISYTIDNLLMPGKVETVNAIVDHRGISAYQQPTAYL